MILIIITKTTHKSQMATNESQRATDKSQMIRRQLQTNPTERFFEYIYKTFFRKDFVFKILQQKFWSYLKGGKSSIWVIEILIPVIEILLDNKWGNFQFLANFLLDIKLWSTERQTNIALFLYSGRLSHSMALVSLYTHWKYVKLTFSGGIERD